MTILHMLPSLVQISFSQKHLSIVTKLKGSVNGTFPIRTDRFFLSKFHEYFKYNFPLLISFVPDFEGKYYLAWFH